LKKIFLNKLTQLFEKDFLKQAYAQAFSVKNIIKQKTGKDFFVQPIIVFSSSKAKMKFGFNKIKGVYVINRIWLSKLILEKENTLKEGDIEVIADIIKRSNIKN
jgi:hypothetical protein